GVLFVMTIAACFSYFGGLPLAETFPLVAAVVILLSCVKMPQVSFQSTIYREIWTGEVMKFVTAALKDTFLAGIADYSKYVSNVGDEAQAIHISSMNVLPEVLINNTTYPIGIADQAIVDKLIELNKYQTVATPITDDEMYASSVKKMDLVKDRHAKAILKTMIKMALHSLAPASNTAAMPVLITTGENDGSGRLRMTMADILNLKTKADDLEIDEASRRLVLSAEHVNDLIFEDKKLEAFFFNKTSGIIQNILSFDIHSHISTPYYNPATKVKLSYGATPVATPGSESRKASVLFSMDRAAKAMGWTKMYLSEAKNDTQFQRNLVNFRQYGIVLPTAEEQRGAIVSGNFA
ncbi:MAG TPA: hypothetical protein VK541_17470, partial [Pedobacter sp.]|uniref:hypothetical protein n=1 Tax=Pedobacter sp. TaxID=1411316 RepID=UPI002CFD009F